MHFAPRHEFSILHHRVANILTISVLTSMKRTENIRGSDQVAMPFVNFSEIGEGLKFLKCHIFANFSKDSEKWVFILYYF